MVEDKRESPLAEELAYWKSNWPEFAKLHPGKHLLIKGSSESLRCPCRIAKARLPREESDRACLRGQGYHAHVGREIGCGHRQGALWLDFARSHAPKKYVQTL